MWLYILLSRPIEMDHSIRSIGLELVPKLADRHYRLERRRPAFDRDRWRHPSLPEDRGNGVLIRPISARYMHQREVGSYEKNYPNV